MRKADTCFTRCIALDAATVAGELAVGLCGERSLVCVAKCDLRLVDWAKRLEQPG